MSYKPQPVDTSSVPLSEEMLALAEPLAENAHDNWARQRLTDGWILGPERRDDRREHPGLVPYLQLSESEKQYDRRIVLETLKALFVFGYHVVPPTPSEQEQILASADSRAAALLLAIQERSADLSELLSLWRRREADVWSSDPRIYRTLGEQLLKLGTPLIANEVTTEGLERWTSDVRLRQLQGLALARGGAIERANFILEELDREGHSDEQTLGILAGTHKQLGILAAQPSEQTRRLNLAYQNYARAYRHYHSPWTGINAATVSLLLGKKDLSDVLARTVQNQCLQEWERRDEGQGDPFWTAATLGEACLLLGEWDQADAWYAIAARSANKRLGDLISTRRQARLILRHLQRDAEPLDRVLRVPRVVVFVGHMIDRPNRAQPRFPAELEGTVARAVRERLIQLDGRVGYASAACGSDILFLESVLGLDGEAHVVLPYDHDVFVRDSVDIVPGADWGRRYDEVLKRAAGVVMASNQKMEGGSVSYDYANLVLHGLAAVRASELQTELVGLAVWDERRGDGPGGTASVVERWKKLDMPVELINLSTILQAECPHLHQPAREIEEFDWPEPDFDTRVMAMLFADAVNFSKLTEEQVPRFVQNFLGAIADLANRSANNSVVRNTWGDGLYFVFEQIRDAGLFALDLCDMVANTRWSDKRLPAGLSLRIALHAGPVYRCEDPITRQLNYTGTHVSRAARIEPITPPGHVYASQAFAALTTVERITDFTCEYVKLTPYAKGYGTFPTYLVKRAAAELPGQR